VLSNFDLILFNFVTINFCSFIILSIWLVLLKIFLPYKISANIIPKDHIPDFTYVVFPYKISGDI
jgi:hypothetical protein